MVRENLLACIIIDPGICHRQACIQGTRVIVSIVLDNLAAGPSDAEIIAEYPLLSPVDIRAAAAYGAALAQEQVFPLYGAMH